MKKLLLQILLFTSPILKAQTDTLYYNNGVKCDKASSYFYRVAELQGEVYLVKDFYSATHIPKMKAYCRRVEPELKFEGKCTRYFESGQKSMEGSYVKDIMWAKWTMWEEGESDSLVINFIFPGGYENVYVPASQTLNRDTALSYRAELLPEFPGGDQGMYMYIAKNIVYPQEAKETGISGTSFVTFVIEKDGSISDVKLLREFVKCPDCDKEAMRVVQAMPKWRPGIQYGRAVRVQFNMPIKFQLR